VTDRGLARGVAQKLAAVDEGFQSVADALADRSDRRKQNTKKTAGGKTSADR